MSVDAFVADKLRPFVGKNIDLVGSQIEDLIDAHPYVVWRWLTPQDKVFAGEVLPWRVNVHVTARHKITKITVG